MATVPPTSAFPPPSGLAPPGLRLASVHHLPLAQTDDAALARAAAEGHPAAASVAWDRFSPLVRGLLRRSLGPSVDVEDQVQEVFLRFFRQIPTLRDPARVRSFLIGITVRVAGTEIRKRRVRRWLRLTDTGAVPEESTTLDEDAREAVTRLYAILDGMGADERLAFVLRHVEGLELTEVAAGLDVSLATAKRKLARATARVFARVERDPVLSAYLGPRPRTDEEGVE
ncbi:RNA polymerase sigma factor [Chondromyces crocatus]|uniref:RNA polymerase sigma factor n=1 Tax=Chondromyces crocatus TaxID=52 RepID=A0A0K1EHC2_CHOCO|nr:sigma-70 family RNA polymerase sigma factor [Chondromyces crocatus]AKT40254.1 RNA polymerase sigma factor [Chondromyces crocatus]